jgi:hypothetical protein
LQSEVTARVFICWGKVLCIANSSCHDDQGNIHEKCHNERKATLDEEVSAGSLPKTKSMPTKHQPYITN